MDDPEIERMNKVILEAEDLVKEEVRTPYNRYSLYIQTVSWLSLVFAHWRLPGIGILVRIFIRLWRRDPELFRKELAACGRASSFIHLKVFVVELLKDMGTMNSVPLWRLMPLHLHNGQNSDEKYAFTYTLTAASIFGAKVLKAQRAAVVFSRLLREKIQ